MSETLEQLKADLSSVSQGLINQAMIERGAGWIEALANEFPVAHGLLMASLYGEPSTVMNLLCIAMPELRPYRRNGKVLEYVGKLQGELRGKRR